MPKDFVLVNFTGDNAAFDIRVSDPAQVFTAMLGLEGWAATELGLESSDIRSILDEMKLEVTVRPKTEDEEGVEDAVCVDD